MDMFRGNPFQQQPVAAYQPVKRTNLISKDDANKLRANVEAFNLGLTHEEILRAACNHYDPDSGLLELREVENEPNVYQCAICGYRFMPKDGLTKEELDEAVQGIEDVLQTIKLMYVDAPEKPLTEYMAIIPLLKKLPKLYRIAADNNAKYEGGNATYSGNISAFNVFSNLLSGGLTPPTMPMSQPVMGQPMMSQPTAAQSAMLAGNAGGGYMPGTTGYAYTPGAGSATPPATSAVEKENEELRRELAELKALQKTGADSVTVTTKMES